MQNPVNDVLLSVIVPVYNAAAYLERSINSLLQQTEMRFEAIFINDGSTDTSQAILERFAHHPQFHIIEQSNMGVSAARNQGLRSARGKFICFLDADDFLPHDAFATWAGLMQENIGMCIGESQHFTPAGEPLDQPANRDASRQMSAAAAVNDVLYFHPRHGICDKVFRADVIRQHQLRFNEEIFNFEDLLFVMNYLYLLQNLQVIVTERVVYHYVKSDNSATRSALREKHFSFARSFGRMKAFMTRQHHRYYYHLVLKVTSSYISKGLNSREFSGAFIEDYIALYRRSFRAYLSSGPMLNPWSLYFTLFFVSPRGVSQLRRLARKA
ncbi:MULTISPECIES: glycosyltransferase family 2 protein [Pantoea]|uniref:glycosyltransferase family 2 protein n=1 Tax=Pantoea TaxID=53335 RepID=UPI000A2583F2|nr:MULTISPECIES: glycosyltransferase family 2 protein [Pantoea]KAA6047727.1 glycosyltransferase family 2 protein [Pantoea sp. Bo_7]KAA6092971.1 glycosyltransferase family 2 protein [Pantoea sp. Bo_10]ORM78358.1 amino acid ABC transporter substrate-binding protein [Pantoea eucrina]